MTRRGASRQVGRLAWPVTGRRMMARPVSSGGARPRMAVTAMTAIVAILLLGLVTLSGMLAGGPGSRPPQKASADQPMAALASGMPRRSGGAGPAGSEVSPNPATRRPQRAASARPTPSAVAHARATPMARPPSGAPTRPAEFDLDRQAIEIGFPLRADTRYQYRNNWLEPRDGSPQAYNHARLNADGELVRLHDGIDIYAAEGEPLVAPFSGVVIDPATRWQPWEPGRYGRTAVIVSSEPASKGYVALLVHAGQLWVEPGDQVARGQVVGTIGRTGNAEAQSIRAHLHFELRAPFLLDWTPTGHDRQLDAFNPYESLVAADPKRG